MSPSAHGTGSIAKDRVKRLQMVVVGEVGCYVFCTPGQLHSRIHRGYGFLPKTYTRSGSSKISTAGELWQLKAAGVGRSRGVPSLNSTQPEI